MGPLQVSSSFFESESFFVQVFLGGHLGLQADLEEEEDEDEDEELLLLLLDSLGLIVIWEGRVFSFAQLESKVFSVPVSSSFLNSSFTQVGCTDPLLANQ